jgi:broad specificity phosphatase PhoE
MANKHGPEIYLVRHGETEWSRSGQHTGSTDIPLTENGRRDAERLGRHLAGRHFDLVLVSPMERARETARLAGYADEAQVRDDLVEWDYGEYEGITTPDIRKERPGWFLWRDGALGGEDAAAVGARADRVVAELRDLGTDAIVFAHGHFLRVFTARWLDMDPAEGGKLALHTGTLSIVGYERELPAIWLWNSPV